MRKLSLFFGLLSFLSVLTFQALSFVSSPTVYAQSGYTAAECDAAGGTWNAQLDGGTCICSSGCKSVQQVRCEQSGGIWQTVTERGVTSNYCDCRVTGLLSINGICTSNCQQSGGTLNGSVCECPSNYELQGSGATGRCIFIRNDSNPEVGECEVNGSVFGITTWYRGLEFDDECNPIVSYEDFDSTDESVNPILIITLNISDMIARLAGIIAVIVVVIGGFKYVLSDGDPQKTADARKTIINALIGAVIAAMAAIIVSLVVNTLGA